MKIIKIKKEIMQNKFKCDIKVKKKLNILNK